MPVKNKTKNYRTPQQNEMIKKAFASKNQKRRAQLVAPVGHSERKVAFGEMTHDVMKIVDESAKVKEKEVFDKAPDRPGAKKKGNKL